MQTRVAVIIVAWNAGEYLPACLDALKQQTRQPDTVVVVDNDSADDTREMLRHQPPWVRLLPLSTNTGFARANNIALAFLSDCEYVALLNPDTRPEPDWLYQLLGAAGPGPPGVDRWQRRRVSRVGSVLAARARQAAE